MGRKVFVSYKYADGHVQNLELYKSATVRDYVDVIEDSLDTSDNIYKGESDGEDLSALSEDQIWEALKSRMFDSTITIVLISKGMRESNKADRQQWIPWEVSYSLRAATRKRSDGSTYTSHPNAMLGVVLPDENGMYSYYYGSRNCCAQKCTTHETDGLFEILRENMFNHTNGARHNCPTIDSVVWTDPSHSYIETVKWESFISCMSTHFDSACTRQECIEEYRIVVNL